MLPAAPHTRSRIAPGLVQRTSQRQRLVLATSSLEAHEKETNWPTAVTLQEAMIVPDSIAVGHVGLAPIDTGSRPHTAGKSVTEFCYRMFESRNRFVTGVRTERNTFVTKVLDSDTTSYTNW